MKTMKKIVRLLLVVCLMVSSFSMVVFAANGKIMFEDPSTKVGETLKLKGVLQADSAIEDRTIVMSYDTAYLKFKSGDNVTETTTGQLTYEVKGQKSGTRVEFYMNFDVLKEGTTTLNVVSYKAWNTSNAAITCDKGSSAIKIAAGTTTTTEPEPTTETPVAPTTATVEVNGASYTFVDTFTVAEIPEGFTESVLEYDGAQHRVVMQQASGIYLGYLVDASGAGAFFMYNSEDATFAPFKQISISDSTSIIVLADTTGVELPEEYVATSALVDGVSFPAWQDTVNTDRCILYAINNRGERALYQFDTTENTYQRLVIAEAEPEEAPQSGLAGFVSENFTYVMLGAGALVLIFIIVVIVLGVKLYNRNAELDDLYEEYGIDLDDEPQVKKVDDDENLFIDIAGAMEDDIVDEPMTIKEEEEVFVDLDVIGANASRNAERTSMDDELEEISKKVSLGKSESFWDDDDFEMDFIDLDD